MAISGMDGGGGGRRSVDSEINMVPMIDLLLCCISFLLLTAVWSTWARLEASAAAPGDASCPECAREEPETLHVQMSRGGLTTLLWKQGAAVLRSREVRAPAPGVASSPRRAGDAELAASVASEWAAYASTHPGAPRAAIPAVLHCDHTTPFGDIARVMDAVLAVRTSAPGAPRPSSAFQVTLAQN